MNTLKTVAEMSVATIASHRMLSGVLEEKTALALLVDDGPFTALLTQEGRIIWGNIRAAEWLRLEVDGIHLASFEELFMPRDWTKMVACLKKLQWGVDQAEVYPFKTLVNDLWCDVLWTMKPFKAVSDRRGLVVVVTAHDITEALRSKMQVTKMETELETAQLLQSAFFPPTILTNGYLHIASYYRPADQCSGDWWGTYEVGEQVDLVIIADVTGHGAASALVTAVTQTSCRAFAKQLRASGGSLLPSRLLHELNEILIETFKGKMFMTVLALVVDRKTQSITLSNAAHVPPLLVREERHGEADVTSILVMGNPIGSGLDSVFEDVTFPYQSRDRLVLYSDGITEARNGQDRMYGPGNFRRSILKHAARPLEDFRDQLIHDAFLYYNERPIDDDFTLVTLEILS